MNENVRSMVLGPSVLYGVAFQCLHFAEEFVTRFYLRAPEFLGFVAWPSEFFVIFNLSWIALWLIAAVGIKRRIRIAFFPVWFFAIGMVGNAIWHPLLCLATGGYFPGLFTSPFGGVIGIMLLSRLRKLTLAEHPWPGSHTN